MTASDARRRGRRDLHPHEEPAVWLRPESGGEGADSADTAPDAAFDGDGDDGGTLFDEQSNVGGTPAFIPSTSGSRLATASTAAVGRDGRPATGYSLSSSTDEDDPQPLHMEVMPGPAPVGPPSTASTSDDEDLSPYVLPEDDLGAGSDDDNTATPTIASTSGSASPAIAGSLLVVPQCTSILRRVEDLYGLLLLRAPRGLQEDQYHTVREGLNISSPVALPALSYVSVTPTAGVSPWLLPMQSFSLVVTGSAEEVSVELILPSAHVRRDVSFTATFENFLSAKLRSDQERLLEPNFIDSPLFNNRPSVLMAGESIQRFTLDGVDVSINDKMVVKLVSPHSPRLVKVTDAFFLLHESDLAPESSEHAGDFVVACDSASHVPGCILSRHWKASEKLCLS